MRLVVGSRDAVPIRSWEGLVLVSKVARRKKGHLGGLPKTIRQALSTNVQHASQFAIHQAPVRSDCKFYRKDMIL